MLFFIPSMSVIRPYWVLTLLIRTGTRPMPMSYIQKLQALDAWVKAQVATIPADKRKLVTNHDALGYFARAYGFKIIGAVIPSATTEAFQILQLNKQWHY